MKLIVIIVNSCFLFSSFMQVEADELLWNSKKKLRWGNFKGFPKPENEAAAITVCKIKMDYYTKKDSLFVHIRAVLVQSKTWVKNESQKPYLLNHEQIHFDIAELYARKLRKAIVGQKMKKSFFANILISIDEKNDQNLASYQTLYDSETQHGCTINKQNEWEKKIAEELKELEAFSNTELKLILSK